MGLKGYLKGLLRRLTIPKPFQDYDAKTQKPKFEATMVTANEAFKKGYAYGYYILRIRVYRDQDNTYGKSIIELTDAIGNDDGLKYNQIDSNSEYIDIYISGTNEDFGEFIFGLWYQVSSPLVLFDRSVISILESFGAIHWFINDSLEDFIPREYSKDTIIKSDLTELTVFEDDLKEIPRNIEKKMFGYIFNINNHYEFLSYDHLAIIYKIEKNYINGRYQWIIDILEKHPDEIKKICNHNSIVLETDTESSEEFDPDIDELI